MIETTLVAGRSYMATVQGPCDAQCTESGAKILTSHGVVDCPHGFYPTNTGVEQRTTHCRGTTIKEPVSEGDGCVAESGGGRTGVQDISERALASDLLNQSTCTGHVCNALPHMHTFHEQALVRQDWRVDKMGRATQDCYQPYVVACRAFGPWTAG